MRRNKRTDEGAALGKEMARLCDSAEPDARLKVPELPPRCSSCAFRDGPHLANGSPETLMTAIKCVMEGVEFQCHDHNRKDQPCSGWAMMVLSRPDDAKPIKMPWDFIGGE